MVVALLYVLCMVSIFETWLSFDDQNMCVSNRVVLRVCMLEV